MSRKPRPTGNPHLALAYLRVSTDAQQNGPEAQRQQIEAWAASKGIQIRGWYSDEVSGGAPLDKRTGLMEAVEGLAEHGAGWLIAAKRDRIARDTVLAAGIDRMVQREGAVIATADGVSSEDTPEGRLIRQILDAFSEYERQLIRARTKVALAAKARRGESVGTASYGTRLEGGKPGPRGGIVGGRIVTDQSEQEVILRVRQLRGEGMSLRKICAALEASGARSRGRGWHVSTVRSILAA